MFEEDEDEKEKKARMKELEKIMKEMDVSEYEILNMMEANGLDRESAMLAISDGW